MLKAAFALLVVTCCLLAASPGQVQHPSVEETKQIEIRGVKVSLPDLVLRDQDGRKVRFYSDLIKDKVVVLSFFYTSCTSSCPMQGKILSELQRLLGDRLGESVFLISVSTDPAKDGLQQLKTWAMRYKARPGWSLVTGDPAEMNNLLVPLIGNKAGSGMHLPVIFIGNDKKGVWTGGAGTFAPEELLKTIDYLLQ
jgi:protein SCO1